MHAFTPLCMKGHMSPVTRKIADRTFAVTTLGCKLNQYESESIRQSLMDSGWEYRPFDEGASVMIINTCTVTAKTDSRCRNAVRRARRIAPGALVVVTGCYAEVDPDVLDAMPEIDVVKGNSSKGSIPGMLEGLISGEKSSGFEGHEDLGLGGIDEFIGHSRAFIKVQEGCDSNCTYCIIPRARGRSRSIEPVKVTSQVIRLEDNGCEEIVLTGIHIGRYGMDLNKGLGLAGLVERILAAGSRARIRLSSIELNEVSEGILSILESDRRLADHLHIPLQSGDDRILERMNRPYTTSQFRERLDEIKSRIPGIAIGTDIIVGFPGEDDTSFERTRDFVKNAPLDYFHVFSYSRRPGTPAAEMKEQVAPQIKKARSTVLIGIGKEKKKEFMLSSVGTKALLLMQGKRSRYSPWYTGISGNYCEVDVRSGSGSEGKLREALITHYSRGRLYGELL